MTAAIGISTVIAVSRSAVHSFHKPSANVICLIAGLGVEGDAHSGVTVKHRSRVARDPSQPNLRQVHLIHAELHEELARAGFKVGPGILGENITTRRLALLELPRGTKLHIGRTAVVEVTGLRNPCRQLDAYQQGLMSAVLDRDERGELVRKAGIMGVVLEGGKVFAGDLIRPELPPMPHQRLTPV
ncbi:MAG: MOSC domain-containing protein [Hyphomicrobiales bacterium]|nr:MOSC domain-containing protein [Hyphomicrobiales bacterium]MBV9434020.1 MOSC domain-containing protein [Hyphomicrobiales bacterium]